MTDDGRNRDTIFEMIHVALRAGATREQARARAAAWCIEQAEHCEEAAHRHRERAPLVLHGEFDEPRRRSGD